MTSVFLASLEGAVEFGDLDQVCEFGSILHEARGKLLHNDARLAHGRELAVEVREHIPIIQAGIDAYPCNRIDLRIAS